MRQRILPRMGMAMLLSFGCVEAQAQFFTSVEYESTEKRTTHQTNMWTAATLGYKSESGNEYSVKTGLSQPSIGHGDRAEAIEGQAKTYFLETDRYLPYAALGVGQRIKSAGHFGYTFITTGIKLPLSSATLVDVGSTWTSAADVDRTYYITRLYATFSFGLTDADWISLRASRCVGVAAVEQDAWRLMYTHFY